MFLHFQQIWANIMFYTRTSFSCTHLTIYVTISPIISSPLKLEQNLYVYLKGLEMYLHIWK